jgi:nucleotide-binding universal stress UspA family protein
MMTRLTHILAATDLSSSSLHAVDRGFVLAQTTGARYTVIHALGIDALAPLRELFGANNAAITQKIVDETREELRGIVGQAERNRGIAAGIRLEEGQATAAISAFADADHADLLLLGAHGAGFLQRVLLGSTASRLLRKSRCPVLVVKQAAQDSYRRILITIDFSPASRTAIDLARTLAPHAHLLLLHVFEVPFEGKMQYAGVGEDIIFQYRIEARERALHQLHELAENAGLTTLDYTVLVLQGDATRQIIEQEEQHDCDLIVMGKHGTHVTEELLLGSVAKRVLAESGSDVLILVDERMTDITPITS